MERQEHDALGSHYPITNYPLPMPYFAFVATKTKNPSCGVKSAGRCVVPGVLRVAVSLSPATSKTPSCVLPASSPSVMMRSIVIGFFDASSLIDPRSLTSPFMVCAYLSAVNVSDTSIPPSPTGWPLNELITHFPWRLASAAALGSAGLVPWATAPAVSVNNIAMIANCFITASPAGERPPNGASFKTTADPHG